MTMGETKPADTLAEYKAALDEADAEECGACALDLDACLYHRGFNRGSQWLQQVIETVFKDDDLANEIYRRAVQRRDAARRQGGTL